MRILCTFPGRHGDIVYALPTLRAIHEAIDDNEVDLAVAPPYRGVCGLAGVQPYIATAFAVPSWLIMETAPMTPRTPPTIPPGYDHVFHLGYQSWPRFPLPYETQATLSEQWPEGLGAVPLIDLSRPWLTRGLPASVDCPWVSVGFSEEWIELKVGILVAVAHRFPKVQFQWIRPWAPGRYDEYGSTGQALPKNICVVHADWAMTAASIGRSEVFLGCNSCAHIVAVGLGVPVVMVEPAEARWHPIFYACGQDGPQVTLVKGNDGRPTFDARHVGDALAMALQAAH